ncbi:MAG: hypothetical protein ACXVNM_14455 [Bacteroidia bacterium]
MNRKNIFLMFFNAFFITIYSQSATVNQFDSNGKKDGKWIVYLDKNWSKVEDSTKAVLKRYTWFDHGVNIYPMGRCGGKNYKLETNYPAGNTFADGEYKWFNGKGKLSSVHVFQNGEYISCKEYYPSGELHQLFDYTEKCKGQSLGWTLFVYDKKGNITLTSPLCKDKNGHWPKMRG